MTSHLSTRIKALLSAALFVIAAGHLSADVYPVFSETPNQLLEEATFERVQLLNGTQTALEAKNAGVDPMLEGELAIVTGTTKGLMWRDSGTTIALLNAQELARLGSKADVASASVVDLGAASGQYVNLTGTTTINGFGVAPAGTMRIVTFASSLWLQNSGSLKLPVADGDILPAEPGDMAMFVSKGGGSWECASYTGGGGAGGAAWLPLNTTAQNLTVLNTLSATDLQMPLGSAAFGAFYVGGGYSETPGGPGTTIDETGIYTDKGLLTLEGIVTPSIEVAGGSGSGGASIGAGVTATGNIDTMGSMYAFTGITTEGNIESYSVHGGAGELTNSSGNVTLAWESRTLALDWSAGSNFSVTGTLSKGAIDAANSVWIVGNGIVAEGSTADGNEGTLFFPDVTGARTWTLPNTTGTLALTSDIVAGLTNTGTHTGALAIGGVSGTATATNTYATAVGTGASAAGSSSTALGRNASAANNDGVALGYNVSASAIRAVAIGPNATASVVDSVGIGSSAIVSNNGGVRIGPSVNGAGYQAVTIGALANTESTSDYAIAIGYNNDATRPYSVAVGPNTLASGTNSLALGRSAAASILNSVGIGTSSSASGIGSVALGSGAVVSGSNAVQIGTGTNATASTFRFLNNTIADANGVIVKDWTNSRLIFVSTGSAATDTRTGLSKYSEQRPFASLTAAQSAATAGDLIIVASGTYVGSNTTNCNLGKHQVNWYFMPGARVHIDSDPATMPGGVRTIFGNISASGTASRMDYAVRGYGEFYNENPTGDNGADNIGVYLKTHSAPASAISIECQSIEAPGFVDTATYDGGNGVRVENGQTLTVKAERITAFNYGVKMVGGGTARITAHYLNGDHAIYNSSDGTGNPHTVVRADLIEGNHVAMADKGYLDLRIAEKGSGGGYGDGAVLVSGTSTLRLSGRIESSSSAISCSASAGSPTVILENATLLGTGTYGMDFNPGEGSGAYGTVNVISKGSYSTLPIDTANGITILAGTLDINAAFE